MAQVLKKVLCSAEATQAVGSIEKASWIWHPDLGKDQPAVVRFSIDFESTGEPLNFHVSADQRFHLMLDGDSIARGPDNGDPNHWAFSTYQLDMTPGKHTFLAEVWWIGEHAPVARMTVRGGFILKAEGTYHERLSSGTAPWQVTHLDGYTFSHWATPHYQAFGDQICVDGRFRGTTGPKAAAAIVSAGHYPDTGYYYNKWILTASPLPDQFSAMWGCGTVRAVADRVIAEGNKITSQEAHHPAGPRVQRWIDGTDDLVVPPHTELSCLCDLNDYYCAFPQLKVSGGRDAELSWGWAEALHLEDLKAKGNRDQVENLCFTGMTDRFIVNGEVQQTYETLWWRAGRYILITIKTAGAAVTLHSPRIEETRYPLENASCFSCDDSRLEGVQKLCFRGLQMNSHEHASDCPYYEQLMYVGDTRLQVLIQYVSSKDDRLLKYCIELFNWSRARGVLGLTTSRYPDSCTQWIPPFSLIWVWMVHDYFYWRNDAGFVKTQVNGTRSVLNAFSAFLNKDHLLEKIPEWTFGDWTSTWDTGYPPGARTGISSIMNLLYLLTLEKMIELEKAVGDPLIAAAYDRQRKLTAAALLRAFWSNERNMMADDASFQNFSEHAQALLILSESFKVNIKKKALKALLREPGLTRTSIYFSFYLFEALFKMKAVKTLRERFEPWQKLVEQGFKTPPENFGDTRSDCHAWASHPMYHLHASILGIQPAEPGFLSAVMRPQDIGWKNIAGTMVHPNGVIESELHFTGATLEGHVTLPGIGGRLEWGPHTVTLHPGVNTIKVANC